MVFCCCCNDVDCSGNVLIYQFGAAAVVLVAHLFSVLLYFCCVVEREGGEREKLATTHTLEIMVDVTRIRTSRSVPRGTLIIFSLLL